VKSTVQGAKQKLYNFPLSAPRRHTKGVEVQTYSFLTFMNESVNEYFYVHNVHIDNKCLLYTDIRTNE